MALIETDKVKFELTDVTSYYGTEEELADPKELGIYESFYLNFEVAGVPILDRVIKKQLHVLSGNIVSLIELIEQVLEKGGKDEYSFMEPKLTFEVGREIDKKTIEKDELLAMFSHREPANIYSFRVWVNSGNWQMIYSGTEVGFSFWLHESELEAFLKELKEEWNNRRKVIF